VRAYLLLLSLRTGNTDTASSHESGNCLAVAVVLLSQVAGRVQCELIGGSHAGYTSISFVQTQLPAIASRAGEDAHGSDILLPERVLDTGNDGADSRGLESGTRSIRESVPRVEGDVLVGHGGRIGGRCRPGSSFDVGEVRCGKMRQSTSVLALRAQAAAGGR
jgi:hypothetical protein